MDSDVNREPSKDPKRVVRPPAGRPSALAMFTAAVASAAAFMVITKSGIAGTLVGAAVFSAVYHGASQGIGQAFERLVTWWLGRRGIEVQSHDELEAGPESAVDEAATSVAGARGLRARRALAVWAPLVLALAAFGASGYSLVTGAPIETVIVRERVVEKPVVQERVVMHTETVTVTVPTPPAYDGAGNAVPVSTSTTTSTTTPTTLPASSTTTTDTTSGEDGATGSTTTTIPSSATSTSAPGN